MFAILPGLPVATFLSQLSSLLVGLHELEWHTGDFVGLHVLLNTPAKLDDLVLVLLVLAFDYSAHLNGLVEIAIDEVL